MKNTGEGQHSLEVSLLPDQIRPLPNRKGVVNNKDATERDPRNRHTGSHVTVKRGVIEA